MTLSQAGLWSKFKKGMLGQSGNPTSAIPNFLPFTVDLLEHQRQPVIAQRPAPKAVPHCGKATFLVEGDLGHRKEASGKSGLNRIFYGFPLRIVLLGSFE
jgi:hypothetical protein